jgi:predicted MFS family arabinose efflux permease
MGGISSCMMEFNGMWWEHSLDAAKPFHAVQVAAGIVRSLSVTVLTSHNLVTIMALHQRSLVLHVQLVLYSFFFWFNQAVQPYLCKELGISDVEIGYLNSFNQLFQFLGAFLIGRFIDSRGAKTALLISHIAATLNYALLYNSTSASLLFLSKVPTLLMAAMQSSQSYITLTSDSQNRSSSLGTLSLSYGLGFVLGPSIGGILSEYIGYFNLALIAALGEAAVAILIYFMLEEVKTNNSANNSSSEENKSQSAFQSFALLRSPRIRWLIVIKFFASIGVSIFHNSFQLVAKNHGIKAGHIGAIMSAVGLLTIFTNTVFIKWISAKHKDERIIKLSLFIIFLCFASISLISQKFILLAIILPITVASATISTILTSNLTKFAPSSVAGAVLALDMSIGSCSRILAPIFAGYAVAAGQFELGGVMATSVATALIIAMKQLKWSEEYSGKEISGGGAVERSQSNNELNLLNAIKKEFTTNSSAHNSNKNNHYINNYINNPDHPPIAVSMSHSSSVENLVSIIPVMSRMSSAVESAADGKKST